MGKDHLHHRLMGIGFSQVQAVLFIYFISLVFAIGALVLEKATTFQALLLLFQGVCILTVVVVLMVVDQDHLEKNANNKMS